MKPNARVGCLALFCLLAMGAWVLFGPSGLLAWSENNRLLGERQKELQQLSMQRDELNRVYILRRVLSPLSPVETMELLLDKLGKTRSNTEFLAAMSG